jgi:glycosyltransferase involved in cell wall biosynthesis
MKILYVASDQHVPGSTGGSVHVLEVARGLAARGHEVHAVVHAKDGLPRQEQREGVHWHRIRWSPDHPYFRFRASGAVEEVAASVRPQVLMERYYNFGGEGITVAHRLRIPSMLEVNSPVLDHPGSLKGALDALLLVRPLRRRRERLCREATAIVSPLVEIVPEFARAKTERVSWGANVEAFQPASERRPQTRERLGIPAEAVVVLFSGSFRPWHGVPVLEAAARRLHDRRDLFFLLVGGTEAADGDGYRGRRLGPVPYETMPEVVAAADIGVAPYDTAKLGQLRLGFYWSPLKIFEYMACGLPTVTVPRFPLTEIVREGEEGRHVREADAADLARVLGELADRPDERRRLGARARRRVVESYSWAAHCGQLEAILTRMAS